MKKVLFLLPFRHGWTIGRPSWPPSMGAQTPFSTRLGPDTNGCNHLCRWTLWHVFGWRKARLWLESIGGTLPSNDRVSLDCRFFQDPQELLKKS